MEKNKEEGIKWNQTEENRKGKRSKRYKNTGNGNREGNFQRE